MQGPLGSIKLIADAQPIYNMEKDQRLIRHRQATSHRFCHGEHGKRNRRKLCQENDAEKSVHFAIIYNVDSKLDYSNIERHLLDLFNKIPNKK